MSRQAATFWAIELGSYLMLQRSTWAIFSGLIAFLTCMPPSPAQEIPVAANGAPVGLTTARQKGTSFGNTHEDEHPALQRRNSRYRLCASDAITLTFPLTPEFNQTVNVQPDGFVSLMGAGDVHLEGLTTQE